jgi:phage protein D
VEKIRRAKISLTYEGKDITKDVEDYVISLVYTDYAHGKSDSLEVVFEDRDRLWQSAWFPEKGAKLKAEIICKNWEAGATKKLPCGVFTIDEVELEGPPDRVNVKAVSALVTTAIRLEKRTKAYENTSLRQIANDIAGRHGLQLFFEGEDVEFKRLDQREESDLAFLKRIAEANGFHVKLAEEKLILYEGKRFDARSPSLTLKRGTAYIKSYRFSSKAFEIYKACEVKYWDAEKKEVLTYRFEPEDAPRVGHVLKINERVESRSAAEKRAKAELRKRNKNELKAELTLMGSPELSAGLNIRIEGFGVYDGVYFIEEARHEVSQGYTTTINIRRVLTY